MVVTGRVDRHLRALVRVPLAASRGGPTTEVEFWIDTAFNGGLTLPRAMAAMLGLPPGVSADAVLADGSQVALESSVCYLDWFGASTGRRRLRPTEHFHCWGRSSLRAGG